MMNPSSNDSIVSPYLLSSIFTSRYHQHLNHLNDLAFNHTKLLQEMMDQSDQRKRSYPEIESNKVDSQNNKRSRKQSNPQQVVRSLDQEASKDENQSDSTVSSMPSASSHPVLPPNIPPISLEKLFETFQKEFLTASSLGMKRFLPTSPSLLPMFPSSIPHPMHPFPHFPRLIHPNQHAAYPPPFHFATAKKRRTKVTDTRISPRVPSKFPHSLPSNPNDLSDDDDLDSSSDQSSEQINDEQNHKSIDYHGFQITSVLTSVHLRKAKLMFFYTRYPSSSVLKAYFLDVRFNKLITAQLVKWFSNFREFFYSQIEKYARQYLAEGVRHAEDLIIRTHSDLYRVLNLHYNRSNQIEVPASFSQAVQVTLREFFLAIQQQKDLESSWKKSIYKVIQRLDDDLPEFFKHDHWMHGI